MPGSKALGSRARLTVVTPILISTLQRLGRNEEATRFVERASAIAPNEHAIQRFTTWDSTQHLSAVAIRLTGRIKRLLQPSDRPGFRMSKCNVRSAFIETREELNLASRLPGPP
jgi:hypothetical protein